MISLFSKILKLILPKFLYRQTRNIYNNTKNRKYRKYDSSSDLKHNEDLLNNLQIDIEFIKKKLSSYGLQYQDKNLSWHYHLFAGLKSKFDKQNKGIFKILEIGTYNGKFANFLSEVFPDTEIITIDLDDNDESFKFTYNRDKKERLSIFLKERKENLNKKNINFIKMNSIELEKNFKNTVFDLIWIDGEHLNPQVTVDIFQCLKLINLKGIICVDDIIQDYNFKKTKYVSNESYQTLQYLDKLNFFKTSYLFKSINEKNLINKKYISISYVKKNLN